MTIKNLIDWASINNNPAPYHAYLTPRKRGKTDHKAQKFLERIYNNEKNADGKDVLFVWIRRNWHDSLNCSRPLFESNIRKFSQKKQSNVNDWEVKEIKLKEAKDWEVKEYAVFYNGTPRIFLVDLFSFKKKRGAIDADVLFEEIVFDEAIPIDGEFLRLGEKDEQWIFHDLLESLKRQNNNLKITFLANDYFWSAWWLDIFDEDMGKLIAMKKQALELKEKEDNSGILRVVTWKDITKKNDEKAKVDWLLYVNLIEGEYDAQSAALDEKVNPFRRNWDDFMIPLVTKSGSSKKYQIKHAVGDYFFCELGERERKKQHFFMHWTKTKKEVDSKLLNYCWDLRDKANSKFINCVIKDKQEWMNRWVNMLKGNKEKLFFTDFRARDWFIEQLRGK